MHSREFDDLTLLSKPLKSPSQTAHPLCPPSDHRGLCDRCGVQPREPGRVVHGQHHRRADAAGRVGGAVVRPRGRHVVAPADARRHCAGRLAHGAAHHPAVVGCRCNQSAVLVLFMPRRRGRGGAGGAGQRSRLRVLPATPGVSGAPGAPQRGAQTRKGRLAAPGTARQAQGALGRGPPLRRHAPRCARSTSRVH